MPPKLKPIQFLGSSQDDLREFPQEVRRVVGLPEEDAENPERGHRNRRKAISADWSKVMKQVDPRLNDTRVTQGSGNIFLDLGFDPAEAEVLALRAEVMIRLEQHLKAQQWTQAEAAKRLGITQPRVSKLKKGVWQDFSLDMLLTLAARAGLHPEVRFAV